MGARARAPQSDTLCHAEKETSVFTRPLYPPRVCDNRLSHLAARAPYAIPRACDIDDAEVNDPDCVSVPPRTLFVVVGRAW